MHGYLRDAPPTLGTRVYGVHPLPRAEHRHPSRLWPIFPIFPPIGRPHPRPPPRTLQPIVDAGGPPPARGTYIPRYLSR